MADDIQSIFFGDWVLGIQVKTFRHRSVPLGIDKWVYLSTTYPSLVVDVFTSLQVHHVLVVLYVRNFRNLEPVYQIRWYGTEKNYGEINGIAENVAEIPRRIYCRCPPRYLVVYNNCFVFGSSSLRPIASCVISKLRCSGISKPASVEGGRGSISSGAIAS